MAAELSLSSPAILLLENWVFISVCQDSMSNFSGFRNQAENKNVAR